MINFWCMCLIFVNIRLYCLLWAAGILIFHHIRYNCLTFLMITTISLHNHDLSPDLSNSDEDYQFKTINSIHVLIFLIVWFQAACKVLPYCLHVSRFVHTISFNYILYFDRKAAISCRPFINQCPYNKGYLTKLNMFNEGRPTHPTTWGGSQRLRHGRLAHV